MGGPTSHWLLVSGLCQLFALFLADVPRDLVGKLPEFGKTAFKVYSGYLDVPGPFTLSPTIDGLRIHYQFHHSQGNPHVDPVVAWHQGGPGGSSILVGLYTEMGYFQTDEKGFHINPYAWNTYANMLYLESPAGSGGKAGFSECIKSKQPAKCSWDDRSQAEAYAHTLMAFFKAFPEFVSNPLHLVGESYFGQYGPNIAAFILNHEPFASSLNLKGLALGNACWGGDEHTVQCNGPYEARNEVELFFGKGLISPSLFHRAHAACKQPAKPDGQGSGVLSAECRRAVDDVYNATGPFNIYDLYDDCPATQEWLTRAGKDMPWLRNSLRLWGSSSSVEGEQNLLGQGGGYDWSCGGMAAADRYFGRKDVREALHLEEPGRSRFAYNLSGPASITLYPNLVTRLRVLIYNGDADACVPYIGNQEWISDLEQQGVLAESSPWRPWYADGLPQTPAGYVTEYAVNGSKQHFSFMTVRLAGHMVPTFQPRAALSLFRRFLASNSEDGSIASSKEALVFQI